MGVNDDFFELGGHSLLATKFLVQIRETFDLDFPLAKFFEGPTVAQMAAYLNEIAEQEAEYFREDMEGVEWEGKEISDDIINPRVLFLICPS